jgi:hypothetical protein
MKAVQTRTNFSTPKRQPKELPKIAIVDYSNKAPVFKLKW